MQKLPGSIYLWLALIIFSASSPVTQKLIQIGSDNFMDGRNPVSFCNILFVGNLCSLIILLPIYGRQWSAENLSNLSSKNWLSLAIISILTGAIVPGFIFHALSITSVNNVILVSRIEPPLVMALSVWILKERVNIWQIAGASLATLGVALTVILQPAKMPMMNASLGLGEILIAIASISNAASTIFSKLQLPQVPLGIYTIFRMALGTIVFFAIALYVYGSEHFMDAASPFLWQWMFIYAAIIVVLGQWLWFTGLKKSTVNEALAIGSFAPIAGTIAAYLILGETLNLAQYIGGSLILMGTIASLTGLKKQAILIERSRQVTLAAQQVEVESDVGFKGV